MKRVIEHSAFQVFYIDNKEHRIRLDSRYTVVVFAGYDTDFVLVTVEVDLTVVTGIGTLKH